MDRIASQSRRAGKQASEVRDKYEEAKRAQSWESRQYQIVRSYLGGDQWLYHSRQNDTVEIMRSNPSRVRVTDNRIASNTRTIYAKLLRRPLQFDVLPKASDDAVLRAARLSQSVVADLARRQRWEQSVRRPALSAMWESGTAVVSVDWDATLGVPLGVGPRGPIATGDVAVTVSTVSEAFCEPGTIDIEGAGWWIRSQALPPDHVKRIHNLDEKPKADVTADFIPSARNAVGRDKSVPLTLVLTYYERPSRANSSGRVCVIVGDDVVSDDPWPFPFKDHLNCVAMRETFVAHRWTGDATAYQAVSLQNAINHNISALVEHAKKAGNARLLIPDAALDLIDELTDEAGEIVPFNPATGKPEWLGPAQLSNWLVELGERLDARLDNIMGVHDISRGTAPGGIESGVGLSILAENDDTPIGFIAKEMADGFGRVASMCAELYEANVSESRQAQVRADDGVTEAVRWTGADLMGQTDVIVPLEAVIPRSREAARARAMEMVKFGFVKTIDDFEMIADIAPYDRAGSRLMPAVDKARRENKHLARGVPLMPADFDAHRLHIDEHNRFRMSETYELLGAELRAIIDDHVKAHEVLAAEDAAGLLMQEGQSPALAAAPSANQPEPLPPAMGGGAAPSDLPPAGPDAQLGGGAESAVVAP